MKKLIGKKRNNNLIHVVFLVNDYFVNNFITVYKLLNKNKKFKVTVVATDFIDLDGTLRNKAKNVYNYLLNEHVDSIISSQNNYIDLKSLNPDFVFYLTPYDIYFPREYDSNLVKEYSKVCHISYGANLIKWKGDYESMNTNPFYDNCSSIFVENIDNYSINNNKLVKVGYVKLDCYNKEELLQKKNERIAVSWKPRCTLADGDSNFFKYKDCIYNYIKDHPEIDFYIFFHQLIERKVKNFGIDDEFNNYISKLNKLPNYHKCNYSNFLEEILNSDIMISDYSSTLAEYSSTGKPIIYSKSNVELNELGNKIVENSYIVENEEELINTLDMLINNNDPKKEKRENECESYFYKDTKYTPSELIIQYLEKNGKKDE